jgi:hypothetical protein
MERDIKRIMEDANVRTYQVTQFKEGGILVKLEGYPLSYIKLVVDDKHNLYNLIVRDSDGFIFKAEKEIKCELLDASIKRVIKEASCT